MSFFIRNNREGQMRKRKFNKNSDEAKKQHGKNKKKIPNKKKFNDNESIASTDEELAEENESKFNDTFQSDSDEEETAQEKRLRLAQEYLKGIEEEEKKRSDYDEGAVAKRLREEYLEDKGWLRKTVASSYTGHNDMIVLKCKEHRDSVSCLCVSSDGKFLYSGSIDGSLVKWSLVDKTKVHGIKYKKNSQDNFKNVRCIAISTDNKFLVLGDTGSNGITVLCANTLKRIKNLQGHRGVVTGLAFRKSSHTLYSASEDRSVKVWNLDEMAYVETLFGHQTSITSIDALTRERAITSGGCDGSIRIWKIVEESQLIFNGPECSIDIVKLINEENFLSGGSNGSLCLWGSLKKKPLSIVPEAHGRNDVNDQPLWITSIATLLNTDLVASGSHDGSIRLWRCGDSFRSLHPIFEIQLSGFINELVFTPDGKNLIAGVGKQHKFGNWWKIPEAKNSVVIIPLIIN